MEMPAVSNDATISRFDKGSEHYQTDSIKYRKLSADRVSQLAAPTSTDVILDIGCGTGTQLIELAGMIKMGIGIDISSGMVQKANEQLIKAGCTNLEFHQIGYGPGTDLPCYADELAGLFDGTVFAVTLDRIHPLVGVLRAMRGR